MLTGRQNLVMLGAARAAGRRDARARADELLQQFELTEAADRPSRATRAGCAAGSTWPPALVTRPPVLFLDEPTTGLDPTSRARMWE